MENSSPSRRSLKTMRVTNVTGSLRDMTINLESDTGLDLSYGDYTDIVQRVLDDSHLDNLADLPLHELSSLFERARMRFPQKIAGIIKKRAKQEPGRKPKPVPSPSSTESKPASKSIEELNFLLPLDKNTAPSFATPTRSLSDRARQIWSRSKGQSQPLKIGRWTSTSIWSRKIRKASFTEDLEAELVDSGSYNAPSFEKMRVNLKDTSQETDPTVDTTEGESSSRSPSISRSSGAIPTSKSDIATSLYSRPVEEYDLMSTSVVIFQEMEMETESDVNSILNKNVELIESSRRTRRSWGCMPLCGMGLM